MEPKKDEGITADDESALDKELNDSIDAVKAGNTLEDKPPVKAEVDDKGPTGPTGPSGESKPNTEVEDPSKPPVAKDTKEEGYEFRIPNKGKFESDESYELRIQLMDQVKRRKGATTPEAKAALSEQINKTKALLKDVNGADKINNLNKTVEDPKVEEDEAMKADRERLKALGGATKEDVQEMVRQERLQLDIKSTLDKFVERTTEMKDQDVREVFFDFVDSNYNWQGKSGKELLTILELAREAMFKPSETVQERVLKAANVNEKVQAMNFPGGSGGGKPGYSAEMRKSIDDLKATGMSEEKAVELLSD